MRERRSRNVSHLWGDKRIFRFFRKHPVLKEYKKHRKNLRSIYMALCEIDSDFGEGIPIGGFTETAATYAGMSRGVVSTYLQALREGGLINYKQTIESEEGEKPKFGPTILTMYKWEETEEDTCAELLLVSLGEWEPKVRQRKSAPTQNLTYKDPIVPIGSKDNNNSADRPMRRNKTTPKKSSVNQKHRQLAKLLETAISRRKKINRLTKTESWPTEIAKLCRSLDDTKAEARVHRAIKFLDRSYEKYGMQSEAHFIPTVESARTLKDKFNRIENAMEREDSTKRGRRIIARDKNETVLEGGEPVLDNKWFRAEDMHINGEWVRTWENHEGERVACDTYPQPDPDGPVIGTPVSELDSDYPHI